MLRFLLPLPILFLTLILTAQNALLQSGPMVGFSEMREAMLWVQTTESAEVRFAYWPEGAPDQKKYTRSYTTRAEEAFTAHLAADQTEPGILYSYQLELNGQPVQLPYPTRFQTQTLWQWRTDPPDFTLAVGSCAYINEEPYDRPGNPYGADYQIFQTIHKRQPDLMIWLGDNTYFREVDWNARTGMLRRYTHDRSIPELQPLLASTHHYAIWDDHDFGPDNSDRSFFHKDHAAEAFRLFWANNGYGLNGQPSITGKFQWADCDFFLLDNRYFRSPNNLQAGEMTILGKEQLEWLIDALVSSRAPFKFVAIGGQVLNTAASHETYINNHTEERAYLLRRIEEEGIRNVIFLTGDRHHTELSRLELANGQVIYDLTASPLTSGTGKNCETEVNALRVEGTCVTIRNFALLEVSGPRTERTLTIRIVDSNGQELWSQEIIPVK